MFLSTGSYVTKTHLPLGGLVGGLAVVADCKPSVEGLILLFFNIGSDEVP